MEFQPHTTTTLCKISPSSNLCNLHCIRTSCLPLSEPFLSVSQLSHFSFFCCISFLSLFCFLFKQRKTVFSFLLFIFFQQLSSVAIGILLNLYKRSWLKPVSPKFCYLYCSPRPWPMKVFTAYSTVAAVGFNKLSHHDVIFLCKSLLTSVL